MLLKQYVYCVCFNQIFPTLSKHKNFIFHFKLNCYPVTCFFRNVKSVYITYKCCRLCVSKLGVQNTIGCFSTKCYVHAKNNNTSIPFKDTTYNTQYPHFSIVLFLRFLVT